MIIPYKGVSPQISPSAFIAPNATIIGDVIIEDGASIWFGAVLRGDMNAIRIGARTSIQDNCVVHCNHERATIVEADCTIGHGVIMEGCVIGRGTLVGMNATVLTRSTVGEECLIAAGSLVLEDAVIPPRVLAVGIPALVKRELSDAFLERLAKAPGEYLRMSAGYIEMGINHER